MVEVRKVVRAMARRKKEATAVQKDAPGMKPTPEMDETPPDGTESTLSQVAFRLGVHRVTLLRMETRGVIPPPRWRRRPLPHRVYSELEIQIIKDLIDLRNRLRDEARNYVDGDTCQMGDFEND